MFLDYFAFAWILGSGLQHLAVSQDGSASAHIELMNFFFSATIHELAWFRSEVGNFGPVDVGSARCLVILEVDFN